MTSASITCLLAFFFFNPIHLFEAEIDLPIGIDLSESYYAFILPPISRVNGSNMQPSHLIAAM